MKTEIVKLKREKSVVWSAIGPTNVVSGLGDDRKRGLQMPR